MRQSCIVAGLLLAVTSACCATELQSFREAFDRSSAIVYGKVVSIEAITDAKSEGEAIVTFQVLRCYKGPSKETLEVLCRGSDAGERFHFAVGTYHIVYAQGSDRLVIASDSRTMAAFEAVTESEGMTEFERLEGEARSKRHGQPGATDNPDGAQH